MFNLFKRLRDWLKGLFSNTSSSNHRSKAGDTPNRLTIRIIGPRGCGKTTYFGAILACPNRNRTVIKNITALEEGKQFEDDAINILAEGGVFEPTFGATSLGQLKQVKFSVTINADGKDDVTLVVLARDYSGEPLEQYDLLTPEVKEMYMTDCQESQAIFLLIDATKYKLDSNYSIAIRKFFNELIGSMNSGWQGRIAFALTKCEHLPMYVDRLQGGSKALIEKYFPTTLNTLKDVCYNKGITLEYFSMSAFGMRGVMLEGNVIMKPSPTDPTQEIACIRYPKVWKPFGLFSPLYWLATGNRFPPQHED